MVDKSNHTFLVVTFAKYCNMEMTTEILTLQIELFCVVFGIVTTSDVAKMSIGSHLNVIAVTKPNNKLFESLW